MLEDRLNEKEKELIHTKSEAARLLSALVDSESKCRQYLTELDCMQRTVKVCTGGGGNLCPCV